MQPFSLSFLSHRFTIVHRLVGWLHAAVVDDATVLHVKLSSKKYIQERRFLYAFLVGHCCLSGCTKTAAAGVVCVQPQRRKREKSLLVGRNAFVIGSEKNLPPPPQKKKNITTKKRCKGHLVLNVRGFYFV